MPLVSVVMPVYNGEKYLREAVASILFQTLTDFEFIIVDDASTDSTREIITSYNDSRIVYVKNEENLKISAALNRGIALAQGKYIARMDCDDISLPDRLEKQIAFLESHAEVSVCGGDIIVFGDGIEENKKTFSHTNGELKCDLIFSPCFAHPAVTIRAAFLKTLDECYKSEFDGLEDYELWLRLAQISDFASLKEVVLKYRKHSSQITQNYSEEFIKKSLRLRKQQLKQYIEFPTDYQAEIFFKALNNEKLGFDEMIVFFDILQKIRSSLKASTIERFFYYNCRILGNRALESSGISFDLLSEFEARYDFVKKESFIQRISNEVLLRMARLKK